MTRALALLASLVLFCSATALAADRYDPRFRFRTLSTPRFDIHFHQGEETQARRLAAIAETVAADLDATLGPASGRVQVILVAQSDLANGWATPLPYNTIEIVATAPAGDTLLGNTSDWLRLVFTHEYTHIVHLSRGRGWASGLRRVFGRQPLLYPNAYLPIWQIEGLAVYEESAMTGEGRLHDSGFRALVDVAAIASRAEPLDRVNGGLVDWPGGHIPYAYGGTFHAFLEQTYGTASLRRLTDATSGRIPYLGAPAFKQVFGRSLGDLWRDFEARTAATAASIPSTATRRTHHGFDVTGPRIGPDGRIFYSVVNPHGFPALMSLAKGDDRPRKLTDRFLGNAIALAGSVIVFDQLETAAQVALQSDLYAIAMSGGDPWRLTHGARAADPDVTSDGRTLVFTVQRDDRRELATMALTAEGRPAGPIATLVSDVGVSYAAPHWSPDRRWIAAERGTAEIVLIDPATKRVVRSVATSSPGRAISPTWMPDGSLIFASDRGGVFGLYRTNVETGDLWRLDATGPYARSPDVSPDGRTLAFVGYTADGYDLFTVDLETARWTRIEAAPLASAGDAASAITPALAPAVVDRPYSPWRTLAPQFWTPTIESDSDEIVVGAATGSLDALGRHAYGVEAGWATSRARPDWQVAYVYDRWRPTLFANVSDDTDPFRDGEVRAREANTGVLVPFRRVRWSQSVLGGFNASTDRFTCTDCPVTDRSVVRRSVRAGWRLRASREYGYSISTESGWTAAVTTELTRAALGADADSGMGALELRGYLPVVPRHGVLAARVAAATSWGDRRTRRVLSASGNGPVPGGFAFGTDAIGLLRGLDEDDLLGRRAVVANADYRFPLLRLDRGLGTLPVFARVLHAAVFADAGNAWNAAFRRKDIHVSVGGELSLDAVLGYRLPLTFTGGVAWVTHDRGAVAFGRVGRAF